MTQASYLWAPPAVVSLPVCGSEARFPVNRIFCIGRNYQAHAIEMSMKGVDKATARPFYFTKTPSALVESGATVPYPPGTADFHYEMELVVALGAPGFRVSEAEAGRLIHGYAAGLDMTRRDLQAVARQQAYPWDLSKNFENAAVCSAIVPARAGEVLEQGSITLALNGVTRQAGDLSQLIWNIREIIADLSHFYHLQPGDLIYTGTPEGVGAVQPGDRLRGEIEGVGTVELSIGQPE